MKNNALIALQSSVIAGESIQAVDARDLYTFLEIKDDFSTWLKRRIEEYQFSENQDFVNFPRKSGKIGRGRPSIEYHITLDMAKELAMVERNERGREARRYFIECEKQLRDQLLEQQNQSLALPRIIRNPEDLSFTERNTSGHFVWWPYQRPSSVWSENVEHGEQRFEEVRQLIEHNPKKAVEWLGFILHGQVASKLSQCGVEYGFRCSVAAMVVRGVRCRDSSEIV